MGEFYSGVNIVGMVKETISMKWTESEENHYDLNIANKN
jgi:hypothetical protein